MGETEEFNTLTFEKKLMQLKDTQESIQGLSSWCLKQRAHHKKIVSSWLSVLKRVKVEQRLVLFYLANDVIQYSKRKNYEFVDSWGLYLQKATPLVREEKVRQKILRIFKIWEQRSVYDDEFLSDLTGLLSAGAIKKTDDEALDFQPQQLVNKIKQCSVLEADTDLRLKYIHESHLQLSDADALCATLKDKNNKEDVEKELNEGIGCMERYTQALQREIVAREALLALLASANQYYSTQRGEVKVVAYAYKNFGARVRAQKRKLDELIPSLPAGGPSPPRADEDVPSPGPDEDLDLPAAADGDDEVSYNIDKTFNTSLSADGSLYNMGLSSFLNSDNPLAMFNDSSPPGATNVNSANKIEVINSRPNENQDFNINDFLKTLVPNENTVNSDNNSVVSGSLSQKSQDALPGLDLLSDGGNPTPPTSFYGSISNSIVSEEPEPYRPEAPNQWNNNSWTMVPTPVPAPVPVAASVPAPGPAPVPAPTPVPPPPPPPRAFSEAPESPPHAPILIPDSPVYRSIPQVQEIPAVDVDHRGILPPPPPPPVLPILGHMEDVDHRLLPLPPPPMPITSAPSRPVQQGHEGTYKSDSTGISQEETIVEKKAERNSTVSFISEDVDHRNLISLTHRPRAAAPLQAPPRLAPPSNLDQDYRVPPLVPPTDIVESVDMDLSEDEDQQGMFPSQPASDRRTSFNNNKVLVGGDNGKTPQPHNLVRIGSGEPARDESPQGPRSAPARPMSNPFDNMPSDLKTFNMPFEKFSTEFRDDRTEDEDAYEEDLRSRGIENPHLRNPSPPSYDEFGDDWRTRPAFPNQRFPRNWGPRTNLRPGFGTGQLWPRNGPRAPNRWMGPRPQRFW